MKYTITTLITLTTLFLIVPISHSGEWQIETEIDPFTDAQRAVIAVSWVDGVQSYLVIRCESEQLQIVVEFNPEKVSEWNVTYRAGKAEARLGSWHGSTSGTGVFHPEPDAFLLELLTAEPKRFVIQVQSQDGYNRRSFFDIDGINDAVKPIREAGCVNQQSE